MMEESDTRSIRYDNPSTSVSQIEKRYALLIGVRDYTASNIRALPHTIHDVLELDKVLQTAGYITKILHSDLPNDLPTQNNIWGELENLAQMTGPGDLLLVYFGGHGDLDDEGNAFLLPADLRSRAAMKRTSINLDDFTQTLVKSPAQARILILDACHSGIGRSGGRMSEAFERHIFQEAEGSAILASCRQGQVAYEHDRSPHGVFTYYLLKGLRGAAKREGKGFITFTDLSHYVTTEVKEWAIRRSCEQHPNASTKLVGDPVLLILPERENLSSSAEPARDSFPDKQLDLEQNIALSTKPTREQILAQLDNTPYALVLGPPGVGKKWLGERHKEHCQQQGKVVFIHSFNKNSDEELLIKLADFMELKIGSGFRELLDRDALNNYSKIPLEDKLELLCRGLSRCPTLIWLQDLHYVREDSPNLKVIKYLVGSRPESCSLLITSEQRPTQRLEPEPIFIHLEGLTLEETKKWFSDEGIFLLQEQLRYIWERTEGYPYYLSLARTTIKFRGVDKAINQLQDVLPIQEPFHYISSIWADCLPEEQEILKILSLLDAQEPLDFVLGCTELAEIKREMALEVLSQLGDKFLLKSSRDRSIEIYHRLFQQFIDTAIDGEKRKFYHHKLGIAYEQRGSTVDDWFKAIKHYMLANLHSQAAVLLIEHADKLLYSSHRLFIFSALADYDLKKLGEMAHRWTDLLEIQGRLAFQLGEYEIALEIYQSLREFQDEANWLLLQGRASCFLGEYSDAIQYLKQAERVAPDKFVKAQVQNELGWVYIREGEPNSFEEAIASFKEGLQVLQIDLKQAEKTTLRRSKVAIDTSMVIRKYQAETAWALRYAGVAYISKGSISAALACWSAALFLWKDLGDIVNMAGIQSNIGAVYTDYRIDLRESKRYLEKAEEAATSQKAIYEKIRVLNNWAYYYYCQRDFSQALERVNQVFKLARQGFRLQRAEALDVRASIYTAVGCWQEAERDYKEAIELSYHIKSVLNLSLMYLDWGRTLEEKTFLVEARQQYNKAEKHLKEALREIESSTDVEEADSIEIHAGLAQVWLNLDRLMEASQQLEETKQLISETTLFFTKARFLRISGEFLQREGNLTLAEENFQKAKQILLEAYEQHQGRHKEEIWVLKDIVKLYEQRGQSVEAQKFSQELKAKLPFYQLESC